MKFIFSLPVLFVPPPRFQYSCDSCVPFFWELAHSLWNFCVNVASLVSLCSFLDLINWTRSDLIGPVVYEGCHKLVYLQGSDSYSRREELEAGRGQSRGYWLAPQSGGSSQLRICCWTSPSGHDPEHFPNSLIFWDSWNAYHVSI